jgi:hypothetical protein
MLSVATQPVSYNLTTAARAEARLGLTSGQDANMATWIEIASREMAAALGFDLVRAEVIDTFAGHGFIDHAPRWFPVAALVSVAYDGVAATLTDYAIAAAGVVRALNGWTQSTDLLWALRFWGGYLTPVDNVASSALSFAEADSSLNLASGSWPLLVAGDRIVVAGSASNNGARTVVSRTAAKVVVAEAVVTEGAGAAMTVAVSNLPAEIEQAVVDMIASLRTGGSGRDATIKSETLGPMSVTYSDAFSSGRPPSVERVVARYGRVL